MIGYIEYLGIPTFIGLVIIGFLCFLQIVGAILEFRGKVVPEIMSIKKYIQRKKQEKKVLSELPELFNEFRQVPDTLKHVQELLNNVEQHYSSDNITKRDGWIHNVNDKLDSYDKLVQELDKKLDRNNADTLALLIDNKRSTIINFASFVTDEKNSVTREQFNRIFKIYEEYEDIIEQNGLTNGEVDIAYRIITEAYENHMRNHTFLEDIRGYSVNN